MTGARPAGLAGLTPPGLTRIVPPGLTGVGPPGSTESTARPRELNGYGPAGMASVSRQPDSLAVVPPALNGVAVRWLTHVSPARPTAYFAASSPSAVSTNGPTLAVTRRLGVTSAWASLFPELRPDLICPRFTNTQPDRRREQHRKTDYPPFHHQLFSASTVPHRVSDITGRNKCKTLMLMQDCDCILHMAVVS